MKKNLTIILCTLLMAVSLPICSQPGYPVRGSSEHLFTNFVTPPKGYGEVSFFWWQGDTLKKERLLDELNMLQNHHITSLQINYAHNDFFDPVKHARPHFKTVPEAFTPEWWSLVNWFTGEAQKRGMSVSLSDYCMGIGQDAYFDKAMEKYPQVRGEMLQNDMQECESTVDMTVKYPIISLTAYRITVNNTVDANSRLDLTAQVKGKTVHATLPKGKWKVYAVQAVLKNWSYDPMNPLSGKGVIENLYQQFDKNVPNQMGKGLDFFFSDELNFQLKGRVWNSQFRAEFLKRKGYDILPLLAALWDDIGPQTPKIRMDYNDVYVSLSEENYFKPVYEYNQSHGMIFGCDHGGRGYQLDEFGDYFRTQRWNQGPGSDQPNLAKNIGKAKVASSIAHLYQRPRVWLEGYYGSGWSTTSSELSDATYSDMAMGYNLLTLHGLYYTTHGRWWEWAPPCNHFHEPYWPHTRQFLTTTERLSYLLSQGYHVADVAILYPVETTVAYPELTRHIRSLAFGVGNELYPKGIDFDFMDYQSLARGVVKDRQLQVSGENYSVIVLPDMKAMNHAALLKLQEFSRQGGIVVQLGASTVATEKEGESKAVEAIMADIMSRPTSYRPDNEKAVSGIVDSLRIRDFQLLTSDNSITPYINHRHIGDTDVYAVYHVAAGAKCFFRAKGQVQLWEPVTGKAYRLTRVESKDNGTIVEMPLESTEMQLIVFSDKTDDTPPSDFCYQDKQQEQRQSLGENWSTQIVPILNNKWGDYYLPKSNEFVGPWIERTNYSLEADGKTASLPSTPVTSTYGPQFLLMGPYPQALPYISLMDTLQAQHSQPYNFSWRFSVEGDCARQGYHGLKEQIHDQFLRLGKLQPRAYSGTMDRVPEKAGHYYYYYSSVNVPAKGYYRILTDTVAPSTLYIDGQKVPQRDSVLLTKGNHPVLLEYDKLCSTYFLFQSTHIHSVPSVLPLSMRWNGDPSILKYDIFPDKKNLTGSYPFTAAPGLDSLQLDVFGQLKVYAGKQLCKTVKRGLTWDGAVKYTVLMPRHFAQPQPILLSIKHQRGYYGGAAINGPVKQYCGQGEFHTGDWSKLDGLANYSGGLRYSKDVEIDANKLKGKVYLDLGSVVSTAEVFVNGVSVGIRVAAPWKFDLTSALHAGSNRIEIQVYNTAGNIYTTIPTAYRKSPVSGILMEPVLIIQRP